MNSLFVTNTYTDMVDRINNLAHNSSAKWGKMDVAQMMAHCKEAFKVPLSDKEMPRMLIGRIFGPFIKSKLYNEDPWKKNLPTSPAFLIRDKRDFKAEKQELLDLVHKFYGAGPMGISIHPHPFFGKITSEQWGKSMYKHLDHHLKQFGE